jgi:APA family basic amino acid/polyamine antiporter
VPALYVCGAATVVAVLVVYRPLTTWPGLVIVLLGVPVYFLLRRATPGGSAGAAPPGP